MDSKLPGKRDVQQNETQRVESANGTSVSRDYENNLLKPFDISLNERSMRARNFKVDSPLHLLLPLSLPASDIFVREILNLSLSLGVLSLPVLSAPRDL